MRFMMLVKGDKDYEAGAPPRPELMAAIGALGEEMARAGKLLEMGGLAPSAMGARLNLEGGSVRVTDGPFSESKEVIGGFSILEVASKEEALAEARKFMELHRVHWPKWEGQIEIRPMYEQDDDVQATQIEASARLG